MSETWTQWLRTKFDTILLLCLFAFLLHAAAAEYHEVLGALLLALTGTRTQRNSDPPPGTVAQLTTTLQQAAPTAPEGAGANL